MYRCIDDGYDKKVVVVVVVVSIYRSRGTSEREILAEKDFSFDFFVTVCSGVQSICEIGVRYRRYKGGGFFDFSFVLLLMRE